MDDASVRERQRQDRDQRAQERGERQMQRELDERRMELERLRESIDREIRDRTARDIQHELSLDLGQDSFEDLAGADLEEYAEPSEPVERRLSFWETPVTSNVSFQTPSFLRMPEESLHNAPKSILKKRYSTPADQKIEEVESFPGDTQPKARLEDSSYFQERIRRHSTPRALGDRRDRISFQDQIAFGDRRDNISFQEQKAFGDRRDRISFQEQKEFGGRRDRIFQEQKRTVNRRDSFPFQEQKAFGDRRDRISFQEQKEFGDRRDRIFQEQKPTVNRIDSFPFQEQKISIPIARTVFQDVDSLPEQDVTILDAGTSQDAEEDEYNDLQIRDRIKALQFQAEQIAKRSQEIISEESQLKESIRMMDDKRREFSKQIERQNKWLLMKREEEMLERQLEQKRVEEAKQRQRLDTLYKQEASLKREMEEDERLLRLRFGIEIQPEFAIDPQLKSEENSQDRLENDLYSKWNMSIQSDTEVKKPDKVGMDTYLDQKRGLVPEFKNTKESDGEGKMKLDEKRTIEPDTEGIRNPATVIIQCKDGIETDPKRTKNSNSTEREEELQKKERYLKQLEEELNRKENEIRRQLHLDPITDMESKEQTIPKVAEPSVRTENTKEDKTKADVQTVTKQEVTHIVKPFISSFSGADPVPQKEVSFDDWKLETKYLINSSPYPDLIINQALRNSLRGHARKVVNTLKPNVTTAEILEKLESVFGNVASGESIVQEFYNAYQKPNESTTLWGIRLEEIFEKAREKGHVTKEQKENMLKNKFWRGLYRTDLKNATHVYFVSDKINFETLRKKVRAEEYEMSQEKRFGLKDKRTELKSIKVEATEEHDDTIKVEMQQQQVQPDSNTQLLIDLARDVKGMKQTMQSSNRNSRRPNYRGRYRSNKGGNIPGNKPPDQNTEVMTSEQKDDNLNA